MKYKKNIEIDGHTKSYSRLCKVEFDDRARINVYGLVD